MSDVGRYRKLYSRLWRHPGFTAIGEGEKVFALYLLTGPQTNRLGLYCLSLATAAEDLGTTPETLKKRLVNVCSAFGWQFDGRSRVFYVPSWFRWNPPENVNVMKGALKDLNEIPPSGLIDAFAQNLEFLSDERVETKNGSTSIRETFIEGLRQRLPNGIRTQEQYQGTESGNQEPEPSALARGAGERKPSSSIEPKALAVARKTIKLTSPNQSIEELIDAFSSVAQSEGLSQFTRSDATAALNAVLSGT